MNSLLIDPAWAIACAFLFSLCVGSFLNVVIHRLPIMMTREWEKEIFCYLKEQEAKQQQEEQEEQEEAYNLSVPASTCPKCEHRIRWY